MRGVELCGSRGSRYMIPVLASGESHTGNQLAAIVTDISTSLNVFPVEERITQIVIEIVSF